MFSKIPSRRKGRSPLGRLQTDSEWLENGMFVNLLLETWECGEIAEIFTSRNCPEFHQPGCNTCYNLVVAVAEPNLN